ncbi:MAG: hypothetical protein QM488_13080, partial [Rhizobiaceae bacterium]
ATEDEHTEMAKPAAKDQHASEEDSAEIATKPAAMDEQATEDEHAEMTKPAAKDEPASEDGHVKMDPKTDKGELAADIGHGAKDERTAEEQFMALEALFGKKGKAAKAKTAAKGEQGGTVEKSEHGETDEQADAGEPAETSETADAGEHGEEVQPEQFETSLEPLPKGPNQPWRLIRHLQLLQDKIVQGKPNALANYRDALVDMSHKLLEDDRVGTWAHERNLMAAATYLLIGGDPDVGRHAFDMSNLSLIQKLPLAAAIAYVDRKYSRAGRLLMAIDIDRLPGSAKGQFALVQAMATPSTKTGKAIGHLEQARRFAPGTLTEEAALRRLIRIAAESADKPEGVDVFFNHANAYFRHYSNSFYATDFLRNYGFGLVQTPDDVGERALAHLKSVVPSLKKEQQIFMIAIVARNAVVLGKLDIGRWASDWLLENVGPGDKLHARIELYQLATSLLDADSYADSAKRLKKLPVEYLGKSDMSLYKALTQLSSRIGSEIIDVEKLKEITRIEKQSFPGDEPELPFDVEKEMVLAKTNPVLMRTEELLEKADRLLER